MIHLIKDLFIEKLMLLGATEFWSHFITKMSLVLTALVVAYLIDRIVRYLLFLAYLFDWLEKVKLIGTTCW